jgi:hypothetical protein
MRRSIYIIIGAIMIVIGFAGGLYSANIAVNSAAKPVTFEPAKAGWGTGMEIYEIGFVWFGIIGFVLLVNGMVNKEEIEASRKNK